MDTNPNDDPRASYHKDANAPEAGSSQDEAANAPEKQEPPNDADAAKDDTAPLPVPPPCSTTSYTDGFAVTDGRNFVTYTYWYDGSLLPSRFTYTPKHVDIEKAPDATTAEDMQAADTQAAEPDIETWLREWDRIQSEAAANLRARQQAPPIQ